MTRTTKREWIEAFLLGLEKSGYTGRVELTLEFNKGGITRLTPLKQEAPDFE
jgi:hypothetical protein